MPTIRTKKPICGCGGDLNSVQLHVLHIHSQNLYSSIAYFVLDDKSTAVPKMDTIPAFAEETDIKKRLI